MREGSTTPGARNRLLLKALADVGLWTLASIAAIPLRIPGHWLDLGSAIPTYLGIGLVVYTTLVLVFRLHRQSWRTVTMMDLQRLALAIVTGTVLMEMVGLLLYSADTGFSRTIPIIGGMLAFLFLGGARVAARIWHEGRLRSDVPAGTQGTKRVLLVGAGDAGTRMARQLHRHPDTGLEAVGFLDDDHSLGRLSISGLKVLGKLDDLPAAVKAHRVDEVLISMPSAPGATTRRVVDLATQANVPCRILPGLTEILSGDVDVSRIRDVEVEDLLRREPVELDLPGGGEYVTDGIVLVTGAGGSIGSELVRQVAYLRPRRLLLYGHGENTLYEIEQELRRTVPDLVHNVIVGDIRDRAKIDETMRRFPPDVVFHAAAHKHVPLMEGNPDEAVLNNVGGTRNLAETAREWGVKRFVNVSTDKAVRPISMLGVTKSLAERVVRDVGLEAGPDQAFVSVRFGNVLGSRGSVVPIFQEQIRRGGPIRVTHPDMTRYFMTIPEASRLVIQAGALGDNGAVYVLDMGTPVRIVDLAQDMIRLSGAQGDDIQIEFTGLRPGEKLHEELFTGDEALGATRFEQIMVAHHEETASQDFGLMVDDLLKVAEERDWPGIDRALQALVPGFELGGRGELAP